MWDWTWFDITYCKWSRWHLNGKRTQAEPLLPDKLSSGKQTVLFFYFLFFVCSTREPHNSLHPKVNIHTWQLRQRWRWGASATKHCIVGWARSCNWQWLREAPSLQTAYAADSRLRWDTKRGHNCIITFKHFFSPPAPRNKANNQQVRRLENNARGPDAFVSGLLMNWKAALKRSFCITWGDLKCAVRAAVGSYCSVHLNENETQHRLPAVTLPPPEQTVFFFFARNCADEDTLWHKLPGQCTTIWPTRCI